MSTLLDESTDYRLIAIFESPRLISKATGDQRLLREHYGDPSAGIIAPDQSWVVCAGQGVELHRIDGESHDFLTDFPIHSIKLDSPHKIRILVDPWSDDASTWSLDADDISITKVCDGPSLQDSAYFDRVDF